MTPANINPLPHARQTLSAEKVAAGIKDIASFLQTKFNFASGNVAIVGVHSRGVLIANRVVSQLKSARTENVLLGELDVALYRDDVGSKEFNPIVRETNLDFGIDGKDIILIDDVLFTGRTTRAAIDQIMDYGRPKSIFLVVLVDRGNRELPIQADFAPIKLQTKRDDSVKLRMSEVDGKDEILVCDPEPK